ncbi:MAG: alpha/beta fold hydrolase [Vicinamibacterales bacterium]
MPQAQTGDRTTGDFVLAEYRFQSGAVLPEVRLHYTTVGTPLRDGSGRIRNGVLVLHGSSGTASQVLADPFTGPLVGPGLPLDPATHFLIVPDLLGMGGSTKPSDGLRRDFPRYGYTDMVDLERRLIAEHFGIERLRAVMGISMGGMHTWLWGARYPGMMDALIPIAALPGRIDGRNLLWRRILSHAIRNDAEWNGGHYTSPPRGYLNIMPMFHMLIQGAARLGERLGTPEEADQYLAALLAEAAQHDATDILYRFEASFDYDISSDLEAIEAPVLAILFADDELNPTELGTIERLIPRVRRGRHVMIPAGPQTDGHRTQVRAAVWSSHVAAFLASLPPLEGLR